MDVNFDELNQQMQDREKEIKDYRSRLINFMQVHDDGSLRVDPDLKQEARQLQEEINKLKDQNKKTEKFYNFAIKKVKDHGIPLIKRGGAAVGAAELAEQISEAQNRLYYSQRDLKIKFLEKQISSTEYEKQIQEIKEKSMTRITELESVNNTLGKEFAKLTKG